MKTEIKLILGLAILTAAGTEAQILSSRLNRNRQVTAANAVAQSSAVDAEAENKKESDLNFADAPLEMVFKIYGQLVDRTVLKDPAVPANTTITIQSRPGQRLTKEEQIEAIEVVLEMNGVHMEPYGTKFTRALPREKVRQEGIPLILDPDAELADTGRVVSMMFNFKNIPLEEAQKVLEGLKSQKGLLLVYERIGSILVTDTQLNINRMREIARAIDVATPVNENVYVRQIRHAGAADIKTALEQIVTESQKELEKEGQSARTAQEPVRATRPYRSLLRRNERENAAQEAAKNVESLVTGVSDADRGMIRGKVLILADERSNKLIIVTAKTNMDFFDKVIEQLDIETTPDVQVKVYRLKYADAEDVSSMINELIGNASNSKSSSTGKQNLNQNAKSGANANMTRNMAQRRTAAAPAGKSGESKAGELSKDNVTVLADKRINGLVVMARREDIPVLESIIESMDVKLSQVLIETMILQVQLTDEMSTGIDWVMAQSQKNKVIQGLSGGGGTAKMSSVGGLTFGAEDLITPGAAGASYYLASKVLNIGAIMNAAKSDNRAKLVASPIIMTLDNKEAKIEATKMRYLLKGYTYSGSTYNGSSVPDYEQKEIGLTAKITPKINPNGTVMLTIEEEFSSLGDSQNIQAATGATSNSQQVVSGISVETTVTRKLSADITVENRQTVVLGGLSQTEYSTVESGIPILKDIPWIGKYLFGSTKEVETRQELLMFLTPYVLDDAESAVAEARRRKLTLSDPKPWDDHGWSASPLADPVSLKETLRRKQREWADQDKEYEAQLEIEKKNLKRVEELKERAKKQTEERKEEAKQLTSQLNAAEEKKADARVEAEIKAREENAGILDQLREEDK